MPSRFGDEYPHVHSFTGNKARNRSPHAFKVLIRPMAKYQDHASIVSILANKAKDTMTGSAVELGND
jgi:hypothetical protein